MPVSQMPTHLTFSLSTVFGFVLVLARVSGAFIFVPLPGLSAGPEVARAMLAITFTLALAPRWPHVSLESPYIGALVVAVLAELALGLTIGVSVSFLSQSFLMPGQTIGMQGRYAYASTVAPST